MKRLLRRTIKFVAFTLMIPIAIMGIVVEIAAALYQAIEHWSERE